MKKTRIVGLLLVFVLVTSCFVGGTFAKYASTASGSDTAVVAKWSISVDGEEIAIDPAADITFDLFNTICDDVNNTTNDANVDDAADANADTNQIIAPGTGGTFSYSVVNNSQVTAEYKVDYTLTNKDGIPVEFSIDEGTTWTTELADVTSAVQLATNATSTIKIQWRWAFNGTDSVNFNSTQTDNTDTKLGIAAQGTAPSITVEATITVVQVD